MKGLGIGRVIHAVTEQGNHRPAVVVSVHADEAITACVFALKGDTFMSAGGGKSDKGDFAGTLDIASINGVHVTTLPYRGEGDYGWHWPEYVE